MMKTMNILEEPWANTYTQMKKKNMVPGQYYTKGVTLEEIAIICHLSKPKHQTSQGFCI